MRMFSPIHVLQGSSARTAIRDTDFRQGEVSSVGAKTPRASIWVGEALAFPWLSRDLHGQLSRVSTDAVVLGL